MGGDAKAAGKSRVARRGAPLILTFDPLHTEPGPGRRPPVVSTGRSGGRRAASERCGRWFAQWPVLRIAWVNPRGLAAVWRHTRSSTAPGRAPHGPCRKEIPVAVTLRQVGLQGRVCGGSKGRAARKGDVAAEIPPFATGADVDCGLLADGQRSYKTFGGKPRPVTAPGREWPWASSSLASHTPVREGLTARASLRWKAALGTQWGQMDVRGNRGPSRVVGPCLPADGPP